MSSALHFNISIRTTAAAVPRSGQHKLCTYVVLRIYFYYVGAYLVVDRTYGTDTKTYWYICTYFFFDHFLAIYGVVPRLSSERDCSNKGSPLPINNNRAVSWITAVDNDCTSPAMLLFFKYYSTTITGDPS